MKEGRKGKSQLDLMEERGGGGRVGDLAEDARRWCYAIPPILFQIAAVCLIHSIVTTRVSMKALICPLSTAENERKPYSFGTLVP